MNTVHRQYGKLMKKGAGDNANVSVLLKDYEDVDQILTKVGHISSTIRSAKHMLTSGTVNRSLKSMERFLGIDPQYPSRSKLNIRGDIQSNPWSERWPWS